MHSTHCLKAGAVFSVFRAVITFLVILFSLNQGFSHSTQTSYCITDEGRIRLFIEHWHGNLTTAQTANAIVRIDVTDTSTGITTTTQALPTGVVWDTTIGNLPGCKGDMTVIQTCAGRANVYNDWAYWDFTPPDCFVALRISVVSISGSASYIFDEACGNLFPSTFTDSFIDCVPPTMTCPSNQVVEVNSNACGANVTGLEPEILFDDCTPVADINLAYQVTGATTASGTGPANIFYNKGVSTVTYMATDNVPSTSSCSFTVTVEDNTGPTLSCPSTLTLECNLSSKSIAITNWLSTITATDFCGVAMITNDFDPAGFAFIDHFLGLEDVAYQSPSKQSVSNKYIENKSSSAAVLSGSTSSGSQTVTFTATDNCGNTATCAAVINIIDTTPPSIICPTNITVECGDPNSDAIISNWLDNASAGDECDTNPVITNNYSASFPGGCDGPTGTTTITFTATDCDNNSSTCTATITVDDTTAPDFDVLPQDITVGCASTTGNTPALTTWLASNGGGVATDDCDPGVTWSSAAGTTTDLCGYTFSRDYTFTITDNCGNTATAVATFTVEDTTPPDINLRWQTLTQTCSANNETNLASYLEQNKIATDVCSPAADVTIDWVVMSDQESCGGTIHRTYLYTATDACGNTSTDIFEYQTTDVAAPTWANVPGTLVLECGAPDNGTTIEQWIEDVEDSMFDVCGGEVFIMNNWDGNLTDGCNQNTTVVWTVTDDCGNSTTLNRTIEVRDSLDPEFVNCPSDFTVNVDVDQCGSNVVFSTPVAFDQCTAQGDLVVTQIAGPASGSSFSTGATTVTFRVTDGCARRDDCSFVITVVDTDEPSINCPSNVEACTGNGSCLWVADDSVNPMTGDNCAGSTVEYSISGATTKARAAGDAEGDSFNLGTSTVCYFVEDSAGNETNCCFDVIISDCEAPSITCPSDILNAACGTTPPASFVATATDNCDPSVTITSQIFNTISGCGSTDITVYQFIATDAAGNIAQCFAQFGAVDAIAPVITTAASDGASDCVSADIDLLSWLNDNGGAEANDACGNVTWSNEFVGAVMTGCSGAPSVTVLFTATDDCGNTATTQADFNVDDTEVPSITCPVDITLECGDAANEAIVNAWLGTSTASDNCSDPTITNNFPSGFTASCGASGAYAVVFTATDDCGNTATCLANVTVEDDADPVFVLSPQDMTVECDGAGNTAALNAWVGNNGGASAMDNCDTALEWVANEEVDIQTCGSTQTITYSFTVTDDCDNETSQTAQFIIEDTTVPVLTAPADLQVECDGAGNAAAITAWLGTATATDICGSATVTTDLFNSENSCGNFEQLTYLFTATDQCGNSSTDLAKVIITDSQAPTLVCPSNLTIYCGTPSNGALVSVWLDSVTSNDNCSDVTVSNNYTGLFPTNCGGALSITFTATDGCGNTATCQADIIMDDNSTPDFVNCPEDMTINVDVDNCGSNPIFSTPSAIDNCGVVVTQTTGPASGTPFPVGTTLLEFLATDECGNTATCGFNITVVDSDDPLVLCPPDLFGRCIKDGTCAMVINDIEPVLGQENCPGFTMAYTITGATTGSGANDASGTSFNIGLSTVCYTLTDASSNSSVCCFDIEVVDCFAPTITCPTDLTVTCDGSGNTTDLATWLASASASDACSTPITFENKQYNTISGCGDTSTTIYEFTATDAEGNATVCYAEFTIQDIIDPIITTEASDLTVECDGANNSNDIQSWLNNFAGAEATDGCGAITFSHNFTGSLSDECAQTGSITVVFTATDDCGNTETTEAEFTIEDTTDPVITCPESIALECGDPLNDAVITNWLATASASDICSDVTFTNDFTTSFAGSCGDAGTYTVIFTATDACGNSSTCEKTITVTDNILPVFDQLPQDLELECADGNNTAVYNSWIAANGSGVAADACGDVTWSVARLDGISSCGNAETVPHVWTITDDCGNFSTAMSSMIITDTSTPTITAPTDMTVECDGIGNDAALIAWLATITGSDTCGDVTTNHILNNTISACGGGSVYEYIFTVEDACGNSSSDVASFTIEDTTVPTITCPSDLNLECGAIGNDQAINAWLTNVNGLDNCSTLSISNDFDGTLPADCNGTVTVEFTATDDCGNTATCTADITMDDTIDPVFVNCPGALTINVDVDACGSNPIFSTPIADDNCNVTVTQTAGLTSGSTFPVGTTAIEFTATDACGNIALCQFDIIVIDSDVPQIFCPSTTVTQCTAIGFCTWNGDASVAPTTSFENCDDYTITYTITGVTTGSGNTTAAGEVFALGLSTVCYTITDVSDNSSTCCFDVIVQDCEAPSLVCPNDLVVECAVNNEVQKNTWLNSAVSQDNCDLAPSIEFTLFNTISGCGGSFTEQYLITASDLAGNSNTCVISFEVQDVTAPVINTAIADVTVECDGSGNSAGLLAWLSNNGNIADASVTEFCSAYDWTNNFNQVSFTENTPCNDDIGYYEVQFWIVDECGNQSNRITKRYNIEDTTDPVLTLPTDITLECGDPLSDALISSWLQDVSASDLCDNDVAVTTASAVINQCGNTNTTTYTFTATDACGNVSTQSAQIVTVDTESPQVTVDPTDLLLECAGASNDDLIEAWEDSFGGSMAVDNCNSAALSWSIQDDVTVAGCGDLETVNYVFVVEDDCGNTSTTSASIIITDTTDPELTLPVDQVQECGAIAVSLTDWIEEATATDDCGDVSISSVLWDTQSGCGSTDIEQYLFTATDACGNATTGIATYTIADTTVPGIVCPSNLELECGNEENDQFINAWLQSVISLDANGCSDVVITHNYTGGFPDPFTCVGGTGTIVTFTSTDDCGNASTCIANILMTDSQVPYFVDCPSNLVVNVDVDLCTTNVVYSTPIALDNCDEMVAVTQLSGPVSGSAFPLGASIVSFEAEDECGNKSTCTFQITVVDSDTPSISCPSNDVVKCNDNGTCTWLADDDVDPLFNDNCTDIDLIYVITGATTATSATTGTNTVSGDAIIFELGTSTVCYTVTDGTGNTGSCCFDVIVEDCEDPTLVCNNELNVECGAEDLTTWFNSIAASISDNCSAVADMTVDTLLLTDRSSCGSTFEKIYLFTVSDEAGNTATCTATYETDDTVVPVIDTEAMDLTIECNGGNQSSSLQAWLNDNGGAEATDVCSEPVSWSNSFTGDLVEFCATNGSVLVVFTVTDDCGNTSTTDATFTIQDTTDPALTLPTDISLECSDDLNETLIANWLLSASASDNCQGSMDVTNNYDSQVATDLCGSTGVTTVTFTVVDGCGNSSTDTRTITIVDTTVPSIQVEARDLLLECADGANSTAITAWEMAQGGASAIDACSDLPLVWTILTQATFEECGSSSRTDYVFQVEDNCGNTSTTTASIQITDTTDPALTLPEEQIEECGNIIVTLTEWLAEASATDTCGDVDIQSVLWNTTSGCGNTDTEQYLFTATDDCGNVSTGIASYQIVDRSDPTIVCPADLILECGNLNNDQIVNFWLESATATDAHDCNDVEITYSYPGSLPDLDCSSTTGITVTFTATDACGNTDQCTAMIILDDTIIPVFQTCPEDMTVNVDVDLCENNVIFSTPTAFDNCDDAVVITQIAGPASGTPFPLGLSTVTFQVIDDCGNSSTCTFDITVIDSDVPSISCPSVDVVQCTDNGQCTWLSDDSTDPLFIDNCAGLMLTYNVTGATTASSAVTGVNTIAGDAVVFNLGSSSVCYTITDGSANSSSCCFDVVIEDCQDPTITCSDDFDVACGSEDLTTWYNSIAATITDNCSAIGDMTVDTLLLTDLSSCGATFEKIYLFTVTDQAGNTATCTATYETDDEVSPVISAEAMDMTIECSDANQSVALQGWLSNNAGAVASDVCSGPIKWTNNFSTDLTPSCGSNGSVLVVFTATDDCGNTSTTSATFTIEDTTVPVLTCPENLVLECSGELNAAIIDGWLDQAVAEDICDGTLDVTNDFGTVFTDACGSTGTHTIIFTVIDACDNSSSCIRTVTLTDTTNPSIDAQAEDLTLECADAGNAAAIAAWQTANGGASASDACSDMDLIWGFTSLTMSDECGATGVTQHTFTVTDNCGNTTTTVANVIIVDTTNPVLTLPEDQVEECGNIAVDLSAWIAEATATDECGDVVITHVLWNTISVCGNNFEEEYFFTATDACGNRSTGIASYATQDTSIPTIVCPLDLILECGNTSNDQLIAAWLESATATDEFGCNDVEITYSYPGDLPTVDCTGAAGITVTFTATDDCDNTDECTAMIIMNDTTVPVFQTCPEDMTVNVDVDLCSTNIVYSTPTAFDACDEDLTITQTAGPASGTPFVLGLNTVTFEVEDNCGNTSECSFDITVIDSGDPSIDCPSNDVVVCTDAGTCTWNSDDKTNPIFNDNCPGLIVTYVITGETTATSATTGVNTVAGDNVIFEIGLSQICYTIEDPSANTATCCFNVIVEDCESPTLTCNDQLDIACGSEDISGWFDGIAATALDNCSTLAELSVDTLLLTDFSSCGSTFEKIYLFTVTDGAGNTSTCTAIYETDDTVVPVIDTEASDLTLECNGNGQSTALQAWLNNNAGAVASDICSGPITWTNDYLGDLTTSCGNNGAVLVTFTATDDCGNTSTTSATFTIEDTTSPILDLPASITLECGGATNDVIIQNWINSAAAEDICEGSLSVTNDYSTAVQTDECGLTGTTTITFTVVDACANISTDTRTVTITDVTSPVITVTPQNLILECADPGNAALIAAWEADFGGSEATDSCSDEDLVWSILNTLPFGTCGDTQSTLYTFQVVDNCGNTSTTSASVIINDTTAPELIVPTDLVVECNNAATTVAQWIATATATDECGDVGITSYLNNTISDCGGTYAEVYIFTATDACGNQTTGTAQYSLEDTTDPIIVCPENLVLNCGNPSNNLIITEWLESATASDPNDCSNVAITFTDPGALPDLDCSGTGGALITWTATDDCGNTSTCQAQIIIEDDEDPVFVNCPTDLTINVDVDLCTSNPIFSTPSATDNCSVTVTQIANASGEILASGTAFPIGTTEVVFLATDLCGNTAVCTFDITVLDSDVPIVLCPSNTIEVDTDPGVCTWTSDDRVSTAFSVENCPDQTLLYDITGTTTASGSDDAAGEIFELGLSTVCYTLTDASGNVSMCCFDVFVMDNEMPVITCPASVTIATADVLFGDCLASFDWTHPTIMDNCDLNGPSTLELVTQTPDFIIDGPTTVNAGTVNTATFELGTTILTYIVTDSNGNTTTCEWSVTVDDTEVPMITCPVDVTFDINDDCAYTEITDQLDATFSDNCAIDMVLHDYLFGLFDNTLAGSSFDIGTTTVTWTAIDESGNSSTCVFDITIEDNDVPDFINCPSDTLVVGSDVDNCSAFVNWSDPIAMDECGVSVAQTAGPDSGDELAPGFYTVTYVATDTNGNTSVCEFVIHVQDTQIPIVLCPSNDMIVETDLGVCTWTSPAESLTATTALTNCPFDLTWTVTNPDATVNTGDNDVSGYTFALGTSTVCYDIIESDDVDNNGFLSSQCCFDVIVEDNEKPQVTCQADVDTVTSAGGTGDCLARYEWAHPTPTDNCGIASMMVLVEDALDNVLGPVAVNAAETMLYDFPIGTSVVSYTIEDNNGNTTSCAFLVTVADDENPEVTCVADVTVSADDNCQYTVVDASLDPSYSDNCNVRLAYHDFIFAPSSGTLAGAKFEFGTTTIVWTIIDDFGNMSTCSHTITVIDDVAPVITNCPANAIVQDSDSGMCQAVVNFSNIAATDNCGGYIEIEYMLSGGLTQAWTQGQASGIMYPVGITNVKYRATDQYGNVSEECMFDIEVVDNIDPVAVCQDIEVMVDFNCMATIMPADIDAGSTDNCGIASLMISEDGVNFFDELNFMSEDLASPFLVITLQVTDTYGNTSICQSSVFVVDEIDPMVICQDDIIVPTEPGVCYAIVPNVIPPIDTTDNCMGISNVRQQPLPGLLFGSEVGDSMFVTVIVEDESGNMDSCQVKLVIEDTEIPQFTNCPRPPVTVAAETDLCSAAANFSVPTGTDNCGEVTINKIDDTGLDSGDWFPIGTTILSYEIVDGSGNADTCHIKVIVNDLQPPSFNCPEDVVQVNDPGFCGAIVKDIEPENIMDNCTDELTLTFAVDWEGTRDNGGVISASGEYFQLGNNVVTYCLEDRPTIVISEVTHEIGATVGANSIPSYFDQGVEEDYIEITNVGPSTVDVSCLVIEKLIGSTGGVGSFTVPFYTMMAPGDVMVIHVGPGTDSPVDLYFNMDIGGSASGDLAGYALMYGECILDVVALNGYNPVGAGDLLTITAADWSGGIPSDAGTAGVYRPFTFDGNNNLDWAVVDDMNPGSIAKVNQNFDVYPDTGLTTSLQSKCGTKICCTFTVEIFDVEPPTMVCPADMVINTSDNGTGDCTSSTTWKHPDIEDNCGTTKYCMTITTPDSMVVENCTITPGVTFVDDFEVGETTVGYLVEDEAGNQTTCSFTITVLDDEDPQFTCPDDLFVQLGAGQCFVNVFSQINLFETDNCGDMTMVSNPDMDGQFNEGDNVVNIVIEDAAGNQRNCSFMITVAAYVPTDTEMACQGTVNVSLNADCEAIISPEMILVAGDYGCLDDLEISLSETHGGGPIPTSPMVTSDHINMSLIVTIYNPATGNSCWGTVLIEDKLVPEIECPMDMTVSCAEGLDPANIGLPTLLSCESSTTMIFTDEIIDNGLCGTPRAIHTRTWIVTDESGNSSTCSHTITVERLESSLVVCPLNYDGVDNPELDCDAVSTNPLLIHPDNTGRPTINGANVLEAEYCPLSINMEDELFDLCDGTYDILRTWRIYDPCKPVLKEGPDRNPIHCTQVIRVRDNTAPVITCPADMTFSVTATSCRADIQFPAAEIVEACGTVSVQFISPFGSLNTNGGVIADIAIGTFQVRYIATDGCGNQSECKMNVTVMDEIQPVVVCNPDVIVSLNNTGVAEVYAQAFDAGSSDNCTLDALLVRRMDTPCGVESDVEFGESVTFCCADVGTTVMVVLRAVDAVGNYNECMIEVVIDDKQEAEITCPADIVVDCGSTNYQDTSVTGVATFTDNCTGNLGTAAHTDQEFIDQCGDGYVLRTWTVGTASCVQRIDLVDPEPFYIADTTCGNLDPDDGIIWPCDVEIESCSQIQDPSVTGEVQVFDDNCSLTGIDYEDQVFTLEADACFKVVRTWKIIDWCTYDSNAGTGYWEYDQVIKIINSMPPVFDSCATVEACTFNDSCTADVTATVSASDDCSTTADLTYNYQLDIDNDGTFNMSGTGSSITETLAVGTHSVLWSVEDGCGNVSACTQLIEVKDCKAPSAYCINGLSTSLESGTGTVTIWASDFDNGSEDNCTAQADLSISFSEDITDGSMTFSCSDLPNGQEESITVQMWVTDTDGNQSFCTTSILVQDVHDACVDVLLPRADIAGRIMTEDDEGVNEVVINMENMDTEEPYDVMTDTIGIYEFGESMPTEYLYAIKPLKDDDDRNGLTALDLLGIQKHILRLDTLDSPYKIIAADVNGSGKISSIDLIELQKLLLGVFNKLPNNSSWRFVNKDFVFVDPTDPWPFEEDRYIDVLMTNEMKEDFIGVKVGDVNGTVEPNKISSESAERRSVISLKAKDRILQSGRVERIDISVSQDMDLNALYFTLEALQDDITITSITSELLPLSESDYATFDKDRVATMLWYDIHSTIVKEGTDLLSIDVVVAEDMLLSEAIQINSSIIDAGVVEVGDVESNLRWDIETLEDAFEVTQNTPNPFVDKTAIDITLSEAADIEIAVYDALGKKVYSYSKYHTADFTHYFNSSDLGDSPGIYTYEVSNGDRIISQSMILLK